MVQKMNSKQNLVFFIGLTLIVMVFWINGYWTILKDGIFTKGPSAQVQPIFPTPQHPGGIPGVAGNKTGYPQWGVNVAATKIIEVSNGRQKVDNIEKGYFVWFKSQKAAQEYLSGQGLF